MPLASYFRPKSLKYFVGQNKVINKKSWLYRAIKYDNVPSLIFWGPPGVGKTTLANIISKETKANFKKISATSSGLAVLRKLVEEAEELRRLGQKTILFIDEIHRWTKSQQDSLLPYIENGVVILIGATTENPSFSINSALLSRVKLIILEPLSKQEILKIINYVIKELDIQIEKEARNILTAAANGDARYALNILESAVESGKQIDSLLIKDIISRPHLFYDKQGDEHYNLISALHKSMRGGDANAAVYYLGRMLEGGEDPLYIARRLIRFASEDIGLANNSALMMANAIYDACDKIGMPECSVNLSHGVIYLSRSSKNIAVYQAYNKVKEEIEKTGNLPVPLHLRNAPTKIMEGLGYGKNYKYSPIDDDNQQTYLPDKIKNKKFI